MLSAPSFELVLASPPTGKLFLKPLCGGAESAYSSHGSPGPRLLICEIGGKLLPGHSLSTLRRQAILLVAQGTIKEGASPFTIKISEPRISGYLEGALWT